MIKRLLLAACLLLLASFTLASEDTPYLTILGVVQDAGYPQIGCYAPHCIPGWEDSDLRRGATSIALVDPAAGSKYLFEATPQLPEQLYRLELQAPDNRFSLDGIFLTHAHIGHYAGLMFLGREALGASSIPVYTMPRMRQFLTDNGPWSQLVTLNNIRLQQLQDQQAQSLGNVTVTPFLVPHRDEYSETVGYRIDGPNKSALFIPDINKWSDWDTDIKELVRSVDYALIDATFYKNGELGNRDMSQIPHPFVSESMELFADFSREDRGRVWFIHMNHSNPLLNSDSPQSRHVQDQGYNVANESVNLSL